MGLKLNTSSGGSVSIEPTNTASNYTLTVPAQTGTVVASDASGNVGVGTSSPTAKVHISSPDGTPPLTLNAIGSDSSRALNFNIAGDNFGKILVPSGSGGAMAFWTGSANSAAERMRIDSSGNLLIGNTSPVSNEKVNITFNNSSKVGTTYYCASSTYTWAAINFLNAGTSQVGYIYPTSTSTQYSTSSDYRLKENISPMTGALSTVTQLKPCTYVWKLTGETSQGFIAHELQEVVPECVSGEKDAVDADGKPIYQGIDTSFLVATLTAAIQELKAVVDAQAERITALENK